MAPQIGQFKQLARQCLRGYGKKKACSLSMGTVMATYSNTK